jgi:CO dehydrogenase maturation factor
MRIAFIGKGGSGKTTLSSAFAQWTAAQRLSTVSIDADINVHSWQALGLPQPITFLSDSGPQLLEYLEPERPELTSALGQIPFIGCLPPALTTNFISLQRDRDFFSTFGQIYADKLALLSTGSYKSEDVGSSCFHVKLFSTQLVAHRLLDTARERVVFDVTAGTDPVATSLCLAYDVHCVVVEPTLKGISVYEDYLRALPIESNVVAVGNKLRKAGDESFLKSHLPSNAYVCSVPYSLNMRAFERGEVDGRLQFQKEIVSQLELIDSVLQAQHRDWSEYFKVLQRWFHRYCEKWYDDTFGLSLGELTEGSTENLIQALGKAKNSNHEIFNASSA